MKRLIVALIILALLAACQPVSRAEQAQQALVTFFDSMHQGDYEKAATVYAGSYEMLILYNPDTDPGDHAALLERACKVNGFQCLSVRVMNFKEYTSTGFYVFVVYFNTAEGDLFVLGPCCGESPSSPPAHYFEYRVVQGNDGKFRVVDLPVYVP